MKFYLQQLSELGVLDDTLVIFFSDHGMRFGDIRKHFTGWLEERLPFLFIHLPEKFKDLYPGMAENVVKNSEKLVSPFDIYVTLKDFLLLMGESSEPIAKGCENCKSLFDEIPDDRKCSDAGIDDSWCACLEYKQMDASKPIVYKIVSQHFLQKLNSDLKKFWKCAQLKLLFVISARSSFREEKNATEYLISFEVAPSNAQLEGMILCFDDICDEFEIVGEISRTNRYGNQSACIKDATLRKYCYCV
jgi:hypothetical protein